MLGHVDGVGTLSAIEKQADFSLVGVHYPASLASYIVPKGSIAIDGISLTVAALGEEDEQGARVGCSDRAVYMAAHQSARRPCRRPR